MGLLDFKRPKWQHKDTTIRLTAVRKLDSSEIEILTTIAIEDLDREVRKAAIKQLTDLAALDSLAEQTTDEDNRRNIADHINHLLHEAIISTDDHALCSEKLKRLNDTELLADLAVKARLPEIRLESVSRINDQLLLTRIVQQNCGRDPACAAVEKISDEELLAILVTKAASKNARRLATEKMAAIETARSKPNQAEITTGKLNILAEKAEKLRQNGNWDNAEAEVEKLRQQWRSLDSDNSHSRHQEFFDTCAAIDQRLEDIRRRRQAEHEKAQRHASRMANLENACNTIEKLTGSVAEDAAASVEQVIREWYEILDGQAPPTVALQKRFTQACRSFHKIREKISQEQELFSPLAQRLGEAERLLKDGKLAKVATILEFLEKDLARTNLKYLNLAPLKTQTTKVELEFEKAREETRQENLANRRRLCEELTVLTGTENIPKAEPRVKALQDEWQAIPPLDDTEGLELNERFQTLLDTFARKDQTFHHDRDWQLWANLGLKEKLLAAVEALDHEDDLEKIFNAVKKNQAAWKEIGSVPPKVSQNLWGKFHGACDRNFQRCAPYLEELKQKKTEAAGRREEICQRADELSTSSEWQKAGDELKALQKEWNSLPHGPRRAEEKLNRRFRKACNLFFEKRHQNYEAEEEKRLQNLKEKELLCEEAEQLSASPNREDSAKYLELQERWKKIGHVPRKQEKEIWKRFRAACDTFFKWLDEQRLENLHLKEALCVEVESIISELSDDTDMKAVAARLAELQQQWKETGPVPRDQQEEIWQRFNEPCDRFFKSRHQQYEEAEKIRLQNQEQKEKLLRQAEDLAIGGTDKKIAAQLQKLQQEWQKMGQAPKEADRELNQQFREVCDAFFEGRRQYFADLDHQRLQSQKAKEALCLRLENLIGTASESVVNGKNKALSLAEQLKMAMEDNFILAGIRGEKKSVNDEIRRLQQEWKKIGPIPGKHEQALEKRFKKGLDIHYRKQNQDNTSPRKK